MIKEVRLPEVSENVESGMVTEVLVKKGDTIKVDQPIIELETDKAVLEVPSSEAGKITEVLVKPDQTIKIGQAIVKVETNSTGGKAVAAEKPKAEEKPPESAKSEGGPPEEKPAEPEPKQPEKPEEEKAEEPPEEKVEPQSEEGEAEEVPPGRVVPASPSVRRLARELGIDIAQVRGGGPGGRISEEDVKSFTKSVVGGTSAAGGGVATSRPLPDLGKWGPIEREALSNVRKITGDTVSYAWTTMPHVTQFDQADITELEAFRKRHGKRVEESGGKLTVTAMLLKVVAAALKVFPRFNASIDMQSMEIVYRKYCNISVAVDTDRGLIVPVVRDVDKKSVLQLAIELNDIAVRARKKKVTPDEFEGGTFAISNQGGIGGTNFTPIILPPQSAILGVSRASMQQVYVDGAFEPRLILPLSLSYDHRVNDGADAARFLNWIVRALQEPMLISLEA